MGGTAASSGGGGVVPASAMPKRRITKKEKRGDLPEPTGPPTPIQPLSLESPMAATIKEVIKTGQLQRLRKLAAELGFRYDENRRTKKFNVGKKQKDITKAKYREIIETLAREKGMM